MTGNSLLLLLRRICPSGNSEEEKRSVTLSRSSGETLAAGGKIIKIKKLAKQQGNTIAKQKYGKMRRAFFSRSRSVTLSRSSGETLAAGGEKNKINKKNMRAPRPHTPRLSLHSLHPAGVACRIFFYLFFLNPRQETIICGEGERIPKKRQVVAAAGLEPATNGL